MTSLQEAWGIPADQGTGRMVGQNFYSGQNRSQDPSLMPMVRNSNQQNPNQQQQQQQQYSSKHQEEDWNVSQAQQQQMIPNISVKVEKSEEERELFRYMRSRLGEMDWERTVKYFKNKCDRRVRSSSGRCGCEGVSEHMEDCKKCRTGCRRKSEFRENLTLYLLVGIFILLLVNLFTPRKVVAK